MGLATNLEKVRHQGRKTGAIFNEHSQVVQEELDKTLVASPTVLNSGFVQNLNANFALT